jgi:hypothetical protein
MQGDVADRVPSVEYQILARKSWSAYIGSALRCGIPMLIGLRIVPYFHIFGIIIFLGFGARLLYRVLYLRSVYIYQDPKGVWQYAGILPWNKGSSGVKWRDIDEAVYYPNLLSWLFKSYTVRIGHRYTKANEIIIRSIRNGNQAAIQINAQHIKLVDAGTLT